MISALTSVVHDSEDAEQEQCIADQQPASLGEVVVICDTAQPYLLHLVETTYFIGAFESATAMQGSISWFRPQQIET